MGVVDEHGEGLPFVHGLESPRHAFERTDACGDVRFVEIEQDSGRDCAEHVLDVEAPPQACLEVDPGRRETGAGAVEVETLGPQLSVVGEPEGEERRPPGVLELLGQLAPPRVADVYGRRRRCGPDEESALGQEVLLHRPVEVEVVLGEVGEDERVEPDAVEAVQHRRVRRRLERDAAVAGVEHLPERPLQVDRLGSRSHDGPNLAADSALDGSEQTRAPARCLEDRVKQEGGRRLAVRPRHAGDLELSGRLAEEDVRCRRHRGA
jgi:hypothetical protein